jgi:hypothetical protein
MPTWSAVKPYLPTADNLLIIYAYSETDNAFENAKFFIETGLHHSAHFIFILNGDAPRLEQVLPNEPNIEVFRRNNSCFDMGSYGDLIREKQILSSRYSKFILLNASIRGPFLPTWSQDCWSTLWLSRISRNTKVSDTYSANTATKHE